MRKSTLKNVREQIPALRSTKGAIGNDPRIRHGLDGRREVLLAALADYDEGMGAGRRGTEHEHSIGEDKAKMSQALSLRAGQSSTGLSRSPKRNEDQSG